MKVKDTIDYSQFEFLSYFTRAELFDLENFLFLRTYKKNQLLFMEGDPRERIYFLKEGFVKLEKVSSDGTMLYVDYVRAYNMFPYGGFFKDNFYHFSASALTNIVVYYIPTRILEEKAMYNTKQIFAIIHHLSKILEYHENRLQTLTTSNVRDRVEQSLACLIKDFGYKNNGRWIIDLPMTLTELSKLTGASRETVSHIYNDLKKSGILILEDRRFIIYDRDYFAV
ncbi:Crp/Fnr family transcriptional regulator [Virgibacillus dokdonensis]|uniref:Global nitrogen regulator n=1 Tax=Virgibacillus dokdonensis TaxID=302167 RepID=A0A2K9IZ07_9BACI|nr:Crp/Fnr family transcriptional regulator [Virgibacillus dokdonensis]AUJ24695.1 Global nitrogen regulator [Virgibacillus dokdonensis]